MNKNVCENYQKMFIQIAHLTILKLKLNQLE